MANFNNQHQEVSVGRFSSQLLNYHGAEKKVILSRGTIGNTFTNGTGSERAPSPENLALSESNLSGGAIDSSQYYPIRSYFLNRGVGLTNASTLALMVLDAAKMVGMSPRALLERELPSGTNVQFNDDMVLAQNELRPLGNKIGFARDIINNNSVQARNIRP